MINLCASKYAFLHRYLNNPLLDFARAEPMPVLPFFFNGSSRGFLHRLQLSRRAKFKLLHLYGQRRKFYLSNKLQKINIKELISDLIQTTHDLSGQCQSPEFL